MPRERKVYLGIDLGGTAVKAGLVSSDWSLLSSVEIPTRAEERKNAVIDRILCLIDRIRCCAERSQVIKAIGIGCPGPIDADRGVVHVAPNLPGWHNVPLRRLVENATGIKTSLINDANAAAWGEKWAGAARGVRSFVLYTLGTGIGGGIIIGDKLVEGYGGMGGELGHTVVVPDGRPCGCGNLGCLEAYASGPAIVREYLHVAQASCLPGRAQDTRAIAGWKPALHGKHIPSKAGRGVSVARWNTPLNLLWTEGSSSESPLERGVPARRRGRGVSGSLENPSPKLVCALAKKGDRAALRAIRTAAMYLGIAIGNIINALNPELVVIGGGLAGAGNTIIIPIREATRANVLPPLRSKFRIVRAQLGNNAGVIGAAGWARVDG